MTKNTNASGVPDPGPERVKGLSTCPLARQSCHSRRSREAQQYARPSSCVRRTPLERCTLRKLGANGMTGRPGTVTQLRGRYLRWDRVTGVGRTVHPAKSFSRNRLEIDRLITILDVDKMRKPDSVEFLRHDTIQVDERSLHPIPTVFAFDTR